MNIGKKWRGWLATAAAGVAALAMTFGGAVGANAAPGDPESPLILPGTGGEPITGEVTIHKYEQDDTVGSPADGLEQPGVSGAGVGGVTFSAQQVESVTVDGASHQFDLSTNEGWRNAGLLVLDENEDWIFDGNEVDSIELAPAIEETTGTEENYSDAVFNGLDIGMYLFTETEAPVNVTRSAPWVMSVPLTHPTDGDSWLYDIHVYPKNSITGVTKEVTDAGATSAGDTVGWTITGDIPLVANPAYDSENAVSPSNLRYLAPTAYLVRDQLDERLAPADTNPVAVSLVNAGAVSLEASDYDVSWDPSAAQGAELDLTFTEAGRAKLGLAVSESAAPADVQVQVELTTVVSTVGGTIGDGIIANQAELFPNAAAVTSDTPVLSPEPETRWGDILIQKVDANDNANNLANASFSVYTSEENAIAGNQPVTINGDAVFTTDADGSVRISGLRYSNFADGESLQGDINSEEPNEGWQYYWIVETEAPEGYELLAEPVRVTVTAAQENVNVTQIENVPANAGFELPLTGGIGTAFLTIAGLLILAAVLVAARRRRASEAAAN